MDNLFFLEAKCVKSGKTFYPRYDFGADDYWVLTYGEKSLPAGQSVAGSHGPRLNISRTRTGPQYRCPWCGNTNYVKCGRCGKITCYNAQSPMFACAHCGNSGRVSGTISGDEMRNMVKTSGSGQ